VTAKSAIEYRIAASLFDVPPVAGNYYRCKSGLTALMVSRVGLPYAKVRKATRAGTAAQA
jgi:hypothetical protein